MASKLSSAAAAEADAAGYETAAIPAHEFGLN